MISSTTQSPKYLQTSPLVKMPVETFKLVIRGKNWSALECTCKSLKELISSIRSVYLNVGLGTKDEAGESIKARAKDAVEFDYTIKLKVGPNCDMGVLYVILNHIEPIEELDLSDCKMDNLQISRGDALVYDCYPLIGLLFSGPNMKNIILPNSLFLKKLNPDYSETYKKKMIQELKKEPKEVKSKKKIKINKFIQIFKFNKTL